MTKKKAPCYIRIREQGSFTILESINKLDDYTEVDEWGVITWIRPEHYKKYSPKHINHLLRQMHLEMEQRIETGLYELYEEA